MSTVALLFCASLQIIPALRRRIFCAKMGLELHVAWEGLFWYI